jgi:ribosomal protein L7/L12
MFPGVSQSDFQRLLDTLRDKGVIEAIKLYREIANVGLAEAKGAIDSLRGGIAPSTPPSALGGRAGQNSEELMRLIREALSYGNKIEAIRHYRKLTNAGLAQAKEAVETMAAGMPLSTTPANRPTTPPPLPSPADTEGGIHAALYRGNKEEAIRLYRQLQGAGLAEAKAAIEGILSRSRWVEPKGFARMARSMLLRILYFVIGSGLLLLAAYQALTASNVRDTELAWGWAIVMLVIGSYFLVRSLARR